MLDFRINTFITVCKHMNFTKAAEELSVTQPAVSQHIQYLENRYGVKLFDYKNKKISLTDEGQYLLDYATTLIHDEVHIQNQLKDLQGRKQHVRFGVTLTIGQFVMPGPVSEYLKQNPDTRLQMTIANTHELLSKLNSGELDFALVEGFFTKSEYDSLVYSTENYIAVAGAGYGNFNKLEDTFSERLIIREPGSGTREIFEKYLENMNYHINDYNNIVEINNIEAIKSLAAAGCGITFLYEAAVREELESGKLVRLDLEDFNVKHDFTFIWRRGSVFSEYYKEFFDLLK